MKSKRKGTTSKSTTPAPSQPQPAFPRRSGSSTFPSPAPESNPRTPEHSDDEISPSQLPPVVFSPVKRRQRRKDESLKSMKGVDALRYSDSEIIAATFLVLKSPAYEHFEISVERRKDGEILFVFTCKVDSVKHAVHRRPRLRTSDGTSNLLAGIKACDRRQGIRATIGTLQSQDLIPYTPANHRTLLALRCARNMRPFNFVQDPLYRAEVEMLQPGISLPDPTTVSRDIKLLYEQLSTHVSAYFKALDTALHLVVDGWTAPLVASFLGLVVVWCEKGTLHQIVLEFVRLKQKHTGKYLAEEIAACLERYGISHLLFSLVMDNTSNCNKTAEVLPSLIPTFLGEEARVRCFNHILHITAQMFMSFFFKKRKPAKKIKQNSDGTEVLIDVDVQEDGDDDVELDDVALEEVEMDDAELVDDDGYVSHNKAVVYSLQDEAVQMMEDADIFLDPAEVSEALSIMPKVAGLARRVHDSGDLKERFDSLVSSDSTLDGSKRMLDRRVATRWNSDFACLKAHIYFRRQVEQLTGLSETKLRSYRLSERQWKMAEDLADALEIFDEPSRLFSNSAIPLIVDVIPAFDDLRLSLEGIRDDEDAENDVSSVMRVAAQAALLMVDKYETLSWKCPIYYIAIVMCPDRKLQWFNKNRGYDVKTQKHIRELVVSHFETYHTTGDSDEDEHSPAPSQGRKGRFVRKVDAPGAGSKAAYPPDHIQTYLKEPPLSPTIIADAGGYLKYWETASGNRPKLAKMGLAFCSTPASSVEAERAFSVGRRHVNFMQHNMASNTFKSKMAMGSWYDAPFFPKITKVSEIIERHSAGETFEGFAQDSDSGSDDSG